MAAPHPKNTNFYQDTLNLRQRYRLSNQQINDIINNKEKRVSQSAINGWLKKFPLSGEERLESFVKNMKLTRYNPGEPSKFWTPEIKNFSRNQVGKIAEAAILYRLLLNNHTVYCSPFDGDVADWLVVTPTKSYKIQVRKAKTPKTGKPIISLCCKDNSKTDEIMRRLTANDYDFIVGYDIYKDNAYVFSYEETKNNKTSITIRDDALEAWHKISCL